MTAEKIATRDGWGKGIVELADKRDDVFVIDCDISSAMKTAAFAEKHGDRYVNLGICEQNGAGFAAGLATTGKIPFVSTYATFGSMRMAEQIRTSVCYPNLNVKFACSHGGLTPGNDGATHQGVEDIGIMRTLPNMKVVMPGDYNATRKLVEAAANIYGPVYLRFVRDPIMQIYDENEEFVIGESKKLKEGKDITIFAIGDMLETALNAAKVLEARHNITVEVVDMYSIKPLDVGAVMNALDRHGKIITAEDHNIINGLGSAVCDVVAECGRGIVRKVGIPDSYGESGKYEQLTKKYKIDCDTIVARAEEIL